MAVRPACSSIAPLLSMLPITALSGVSSRIRSNASVCVAGTWPKVVTSVRQGRERTWVDRAKSRVVRQTSRTVSGELSNWDSAYRFALANELSGDRPWLGTLHRGAIYNRVLGGSEIDQSFAAGARPENATTATDSGAPTATDSTADGGGVTGGTDSTQPASETTISEPVLLTGSAVLSWKPPATRSDGAPLSFAEIAGYVLYYGVAPGNYSSSISINDAYTTSVTVADLPRGTYYFAVTTRDTSGMESAYSKAAMRVID